MGGNPMFSFRVPSDLYESIDAAASEMDVSKSQLGREALALGLSEMDGAPEYLRHQAATKRLINQHKKERRRGKFATEFSNQLVKSFKRGETPEEFRSSVAGYIAEAENIDTLPTGEDAEEWVREKLQYYRAAYQAQEFDHDPRDDPLGQFEGIQNAKQWMRRADNIARESRKGNHSRARELARYALNDGVVPDAVEGVATEKDSPVAVIDAATELADDGNALEGGGTDALPGGDGADE